MNIYVHTIEDVQEKLQARLTRATTFTRLHETLAPYLSTMQGQKRFTIKHAKLIAERIKAQDIPSVCDVRAVKTQNYKRETCYKIVITLFSNERVELSNEYNTEIPTEQALLEEVQRWNHTEVMTETARQIETLDHDHARATELVNELNTLKQLIY